MRKKFFIRSDRLQICSLLDRSTIGKRLKRYSRPTVLFVRWRQHTGTIRPNSTLWANDR